MVVRREVRFHVPPNGGAYVVPVPGRQSCASGLVPAASLAALFLAWRGKLPCSTGDTFWTFNGGFEPCIVVRTAKL